MPDTFDLDDLFADLQHDIEQITRGPGALDAVRTSRRRRQTRRVSVVAAVALAAIGAGAVVLSGGGGDRALEPAGRPLPSPAPLSAQGMDDATRGWTGTWLPVSSDTTDFVGTQVNVPCFLVQDQTVAQPTRVGNSTFLTTDHSQLVMFRTGMRGTEAAAQEYDATIASFDACPSDAQQTFSYPGGAEVTVASLPDARGAEVVTVATRYADRAGILLLGSVDTVPTSAQAAALADVTLAATMDDATYSQVMPQSGVGRTDPAQTAGQVWPQTLEPALVGWSIPWNPRIPSGSSEADPNVSMSECIGRPDAHDNGNGLWINVGTEGAQMVHWSPSETAAVQEVEDVQHGLASCSTPYDIHTVTLPSGRPVVVAAGPDVVLWFTRVASHVLVLQLPAGNSAPPDEVSVKVGEVLEHVLEQPATTTVPPGETNVPSWLQKGIADAPTFGP